jgi:hypothetical protein
MPPRPKKLDCDKAAVRGDVRGCLNGSTKQIIIEDELTNPYVTNSSSAAAAADHTPRVHPCYDNA